MPEYPFVYLNHGPLDPDSFGKLGTAWIAFGGTLTGDALAEVADSCPPPLHGAVCADDAIFYCETGWDGYKFEVAGTYGDDSLDVTAQAAMAFSADVEAWVRSVHEVVPVAFFIGPGYTYDEATDWATWSATQISTVVVPWLEHYLDTHPDLPEGDEDDDDDDEFGEGAGTVVAPMNLDYLGTIVDHLAPEGLSGSSPRIQALAARLGWNDETV